MQHVDNLVCNKVQLYTHTRLVPAFIFALLAVVAGCASVPTTEKEEGEFVSYIDLATNYLEQGNLNGAKSSLEKAEDISSNDPRLHHTYGLYYQFAGNFENAEESFLLALEAQPNFPRARNNFGVFLAKIERDAEALVELRKAASNPQYSQRAVAYENMTQIALKINDLSLAVDSIQNAVNQDPGEKRYYIRAAHLLHLAKDYGKARDLFSEFLRLTDEQRIEPTSEQLQIGFAIARSLKDENYENFIRARLELLVQEGNSQ